MSRQGEIELTWENEEGEEVTHTFPSTNEVCNDCGGYGTHLTPGMRDHAYSQEEFAESFDDEEREEYFSRGGRYDVQCETCHGSKVVEVVDESRLSEEQKVLFAEWEEREERHAQWDAEDRATRRMENGGYDG